MSNLTKAQALALAFQSLDVASDVVFPSVNPEGSEQAWFGFLNDILNLCLPRADVANPNSLPPIVYFEEFLEGASELNPLSDDDPETDGMGFKFGTVDDRNEYYVTGTNAETGSITIPDDAPGGWLQMTTAGAENDALNAQMKGGPFKLAANKPLIYETRIMVEDVSETSWFMGLAIKDTEDITGSGAVGSCDDCVGFYGIEEVNINYWSAEDGNDSYADTGSDIADGSIATMDAEAVRLGFKWDGVDSLSFYVNGTLAVTLSATDDNVNQDEPMSPIMALDATNGAAPETLWVDYVSIIQRR
jgi:hypothetical protein